MLDVTLPIVATMSIELTPASGLTLVNPAPATLTTNPLVPATFNLSMRAISTDTARLLPSGGNSGQVLAKTSGGDYAVGWIDPPSGLEFPFAWGDASPRQITIATAGKIVLSASIHIYEAFDGVGAQLEIGDAGNAGRLLSPSQNDPSTVGSYETAPTLSYGVDTPILLTITPGSGAAHGRGLVVMTIQQ